MLWFVILGLVAIALIVALMIAARAQPLDEPDTHQRCPSCEAPMVPLTDGPSTEPGQVRSYDVVACARCPQAHTLVHGVRSRLAYCPACHQRALDTPCAPHKGLQGGALRVEVHERCHLCGHAAQVRVEGAPPRPPGKVIPFVRRNRRPQG